MRTPLPRPSHPVGDPPPLVEFARVSKFFRPDDPALFDVSFKVEAGEFLYITGTSGAGKSTLLHLITLTHRPDTGAIYFNGHDIARLKPTAVSVLRRSMGIVFQDFRLIEDMTVAANIALPLEVRGMAPAAISARIGQVLEQVGLEGMETERAGALSGGQKQRVAIARALVARPQLIVADEPTGSLDTYSANFVLDMLETVHAQGTTVIVATHDRLLMAARPHRTLALEDGRIVGISRDGAFKSKGNRPDNAQVAS